MESRERRQESAAWVAAAHLEAAEAAGDQARAAAQPVQRPADMAAAVVAAARATGHVGEVLRAA